MRIAMPESEDIPVLSDYTIGFQISIVGEAYSKSGGFLQTSQTHNTLLYVETADINGEYDNLCFFPQHVRKRPYFRAFLGKYNVYA